MKVTVICGDRNSGKTTTLKKIIAKADRRYLGYVSESDNNKDVFYLRNVYTNEIIKVLQTEKCLSTQKIGKYFIRQNAFREAIKILLNQIESQMTEDFTLVLDEVGALELSGSGFNVVLEKIASSNISLIICVRKSFVEQVCSKYKFEDCNIINV